MERKKRLDIENEDLLVFGPETAPDIGLNSDAVSHMEMTGLIPSIALDELEADSYEDIEDYKA